MKCKHPCGCVTEDYKGGIKFLQMCKRHRRKEANYIWIGINHLSKSGEQGLVVSK